MDGHRRSDFERLLTKVPPENVQEVENFYKEMQALDADEVEEEIEKREL